MMIDTNKLTFGEWGTRRRARILDQMDQYIKTHITDDDSIRSWKIWGIYDMTDEEVLEMAEDDVRFINALYYFEAIIAGTKSEDLLTIKFGRFD